MKRFTKNIVERINNNPCVRVIKRGDCTSLQWGKPMSPIGDGFLYHLYWEVGQDGQVVWLEFNSSQNRVADTGMTCISSDINLEGDDLFVTIDDLDQEKDEILAIADKIYTETKNAGN